MKLRDYELKAVRELPSELRQHRKVIAVGPTVIGAALIRRDPDTRTLWLAHRIELLRQARDQLAAAGIPKRDIGILSGAETANEDARVLVASVDMFRTRTVPKGIRRIVVDEAHHVAADKYKAILEEAPNAEVLGLTATPWRLDGAPLGDVFTTMYIIAEVVELAADGWIAAPHVYSLPKEDAKHLVKGIGGSGADYSMRKLEGHMRRQKLMGNVVGEWNRLGKGMPTILYATTLRHARDLMEKGIKVELNGEVLSIRGWAVRLGISASALGKRLKRWPLEKALTIRSKSPP